MAKRSTALSIASALATLLASADIKQPMTTAEKIKEAELIVHGVATLEGLPLAETKHPVQRPCKVVVLQTLWPTNQAGANHIIVDLFAWTQWPDSWWHYNSQTGVYFFMRTATALEKYREETRTLGLHYDSNKVDEKIFGTNFWYPVNRRVGDWYEPEARTAIIQQMIKETKR